MLRVCAALIAAAMVFTSIMVSVADIYATTNTAKLITNKDVYGADEPILVTASGDSTDLVGLYKRGETASDVPIYSYQVGGETGGIQHQSGVQYDIRAYGVASSARLEDAKLPAGAYTVILSKAKTEVLRKDITITGTSAFDGNKILITNKLNYNVGEDIIVTASGTGKDWVGLYKKGTKPGLEANGGTSSVCYYYVNSNTQVSGKPFILQQGIGLTASNGQLSEGEYYLVLMENDGYNQLARVDNIVIEARPESVTYKLENETDGFANGTVTITKGEGVDLNACMLYWGDAEGNLLKGYATLGKTKLTGTVTQQKMQANTIIPPEAKTLLAYGFKNNNQSKSAAVAELPAGAAYQLEDTSREKTRFVVGSDLHLVNKGMLNEVNADTNYHFELALRDIVKNFPGATGFFANGDITDGGLSSQFNEAWNILNSVSGAPKLHMSIGNHDWYTGNPSGQFQNYVSLFNPAVQTNTVYYDEWVGGYHFIFLGSEVQGHYATLSNTQLNWLNQLLEADTETDPTKPVFIFLHQGLLGAMAGTFPGQWGYDSTLGVAQDKELRGILQKYGQTVLFGGHTHYVLDADNSVTPGSGDLPVCVNTSSVGYLWDDTDVAVGVYKEGSEGYFVQVFEDKVYMFGRNFITGEYLPSAMYVIEPAQLSVEQTKITMRIGDDSVPINAKTQAGMQLTYKSSNSHVATVDNRGYISAVALGTAKIYVSTNSSNTNTVNRRIITVTVTDADESYSITYKDTDGNVLTGFSPSSYTYKEAKLGAIPLPDTTDKDGYQFGGWYTNQNLSGSPVTAIPKGSSGNKEFYGKWTPISYTITYHDGTEVLTQLSPTSYTIESENIILPTLTKEGYVFEGWFDNAEFTGGEITGIPMGSTGDKTFYAKFRNHGYTVYFDTRGGSEVAEQSVDYNGTATRPTPDPTKLGYIFEGWVTESGEDYDFNWKITEDTVLYAKWSENKCTVTFDSMGGSTVTSQEVTYGQSVNAPDNPAREGYHFSGWATSEDGTNAYNFRDPVIKAFTLYAKWSPITYKITFMSNDGTAVADMEYNIESETIVLPTINKTGYNFDGWYSDADLSGSAVTSVSKGTMGNKIFYAKWTPLSYTVTFDTDGGSEIEAQHVVYGDTAVVPETPTKTGYTFKRWITESGKSFSFGTAITEDITIYAKWSRNSYTVRFDTDGGSEVESQTVLYKTKATRPETDPTKLAYSFEGWVTSKDGTEAFNFNQKITEDTTIYAKWKLKDKYTVSFQTDGGTKIKDQAIQEGQLATKPAAPKRTGYNFENWYKDEKLSEEFNFSEPIMGNTRIYAKWNPISYTITYDANGGKPVAADTYTIETETFVLPAATKDGYRFLGWRAGDGRSYTTIEQGSTGDLTLVAEWMELEDIAIDKTRYDFADTIHVTTNYEKEGAWVGLYKVGETPGKDNFILKYSVPESGTTVDLYTSEIVEKNQQKNEFYKDTGRLKSGGYEIYIFKDGGTEILNKIYFSIVTEMDGDPVVIKPTCTEPGITMTYYTDGTVVKSDAKTPLGHDMVSATCEEKGYCQREGCDYETESALGHKTNLVTETEVSCTKDGNLRHYACKQCGGYFEDEGGTKPLDNVVVSAPGHNMTHHDQVNPTCEEDGTKAYYYCAACKQYFKDEDGKSVLDDIVIEKTGHTDGSAATCTQPQCCTVCGDELQPALGHTEGPAATCTTDQNCTVCGELLVKAFKHKADAGPTCTTPQRCITCGIDLAAPLGHKPKEHILCTDDYQCRVCNEVLGKGEDHKPGAAATCTSPQQCLKCSYVIESVRPHDFLPATCQVPKTCRDCGKTEGGLDGHHPDKTAPTCTEGQHCTICKKSLSKAAGHVKGASATCTTAQICLVCKIELVSPLGHVPGRDATCSEPQKCLECQAVLTEPDPKLHKPGKAATCTTAQICQVCKTELQPALGHKPGTPATCKEPQKCLTCQTVLVEPSSKLHKPGASATCTENQICTVCNAVLEEAYGHTERVVKGKEPTCTETGLSDGKECAECSTTLQRREVIAAKGHTPGPAATCQTPQRCTECQTIIKDILDHKPGSAATCLTSQNCTECDEVIVAAKGHTPGAEATCTTDQVCQDCNVVLAAKLEHIWIKGSCTVDTTCRRCDDRIAAPGHALVELEAVESTCTKTGLTAGKKCSTCGEITVVQNVTKKKAHKESAIPGKVPTCTESGMTDGAACTTCNGILWSQQVIPALGHFGETSVTAATYKKDGEVRDTCGRCGTILSSRTISAIDKVKLSCSTYTYNGKAKNPTIMVKDKDGRIISNAFYAVNVPKGRKNVGTYTYTITFKEQYAGSSKLKIVVKPAKPTWLKVSAKKNTVTVKWKKVSKQATGYEVMYSTSKSFKKGTATKTKKITKSKTTTLKLTKLKAKKTYYVKIRTYKVVGKTKYYSSWSAVKRIKTKEPL
ncbi:MAG: InlB B-repeat-containing protein [Firmicutes bacterium]|nr:InlB B-repeat-containing protein [Bacillota bacterium]